MGSYRIDQCAKCKYFSAGGQHPCDPFCTKNQDINSKKLCPIYNKEHNESTRSVQ